MSDCVTREAVDALERIVKELQYNREQNKENEVRLECKIDELKDEVKYLRQYLMENNK